MRIGAFLANAVVIAMLLAMLKWWGHATRRARLWAVGLWVVVMALGIWYSGALKN
jgi:hypothetical protein